MKGLKPVKAHMVVMIASLLLSAAAATNHFVGWDLSSDLQEWASQATFHVGDSPVFSYTRVHEVLEVNATDYGTCHTVNPLETYKDGETVIPLMEEETGTSYVDDWATAPQAHVLPQLIAVPPHQHLAQPHIPRRWKHLLSYALVLGTILCHDNSL